MTKTTKIALVAVVGVVVVGGGYLIFSRRSAAPKRIQTGPDSSVPIGVPPPIDVGVNMPGTDYGITTPSTGPALQGRGKLRTF